MEFINRMRKNKKGFTLVEIIVVLVILAILAAFTIPTMLGFVSDAKGKALISEAREVYVAAQATATEYNGKTTLTGDNLGSAALLATSPVDVSKQMSAYLSKDISPSKTAKPSDGTAFWTVTLDTTNTSKVTKITYDKNGYTVTIDKTGSNDGTTVVKNT